MESAYKMKGRVYWFIAFFLLLFLVPLAKAQGTYAAAFCNVSDVNAIINGPTHAAVNGDTTTNCELSEAK
jgi:hypothetical protein